MTGAFASTAGWHEPLGPTRQRIAHTKAAHRFDEPGEPRPAQPREAAALEPADDRLIDAAQQFELSLRDAEPPAPAAHDAADELEAAGCARVGVRRLERLPTQAANDGRRRSPGDFVSRRNQSPSNRCPSKHSRGLMPLECITWRSSRVKVPHGSGDEPGLMHPSCITREHMAPARHRPAVTA